MHHATIYARVREAADAVARETPSLVGTVAGSNRIYERVFHGHTVTADERRIFQSARAKHGYVLTSR